MGRVVHVSDATVASWLRNEPLCQLFPFIAQARREADSAGPIVTGCCAARKAALASVANRSSQKRIVEIKRKVASLSEHETLLFKNTLGYSSTVISYLDKSGKVLTVTR